MSLQIHLFDIDIPGKITFKESKMLTAGETPTVVDTGIFSILLSGINQITHKIVLETAPLF